MANSKINIYYSADNRLYKQFLISLISLTENNKDNELHIINFDVEIREYNKSGKKLNNSQISTIETIIKKYNKKNTFREVNVSDLVRKHLLISTSPNANIENKEYKFNAYLYIRLLFPFVKNMPKKIIWLDCDTIINRDLSDYWNIDVSQVDFAATRDIAKFKIALPKWALTKENKNTYMLQNGVLLFETKNLEPIYLQILELYKTKLLGNFGDMAFLNLLSKNKMEVSVGFNCYKYTKNCYIHHVCATGICPGWIFGNFLYYCVKKCSSLNGSLNRIDVFFPFHYIFSKIIRKIKPDDSRIKSLYPAYKKYFDAAETYLQK